MARPAQFGNRFRLTLITGDAAVADIADRAGVDRIGVDLERLGKAARQVGHDTFISPHTWEDLGAIRQAVRKAELLVRLNPLNPGTAFEVEAALGLGAEVLMLPYFRTPAEVETFVRIVRGRAAVHPLIETAPALVRVREIAAVRGVDEVMIGLNDLRLQLGVASHFEVLASPLTDVVAHEIRRAGLPLAIGGVAPPGLAGLPVDPDLVLAQYPRLDATGAWLARSFVRAVGAGADFARGVVELRDRLTHWASETPAALEEQREQLARLAMRFDPTVTPQQETGRTAATR